MLLNVLLESKVAGLLCLRLLQGVAGVVPT